MAVEDGGERGSLLERLGDCDLDAFRGGEGGRKSQEALTDLLKKVAAVSHHMYTVARVLRPIEAEAKRAALLVSVWQSFCPPR